MQLMDGMGPEDLGLRSSTSASTLPVGVIRTHSVFECPEFEVVVFLFPARSTIPLHDHPGMSVFSKVLYGALSMRSFDWVEPVSPADLRGEAAPTKRSQP
jgi:plant cysteine oxidase